MFAAGPVFDQTIERVCEGNRIIRWHENGRALPGFAEAWDIAEDQCAAAQSRFQSGQTEWFVTCRQNENRSMRQLPLDIMRFEFPQATDILQRNSRSSGMLAIARHRNRPWNVWCNLIDNAQIFRLVPDSATRKNK